MDWFGFEMPLYYDLDGSAARQAAMAAPLEWLALLPAALVVAVAVALVLRGRRRRSFWCAGVEREVVVEFRHGHVRSCTAFEEPSAIACARRCRDAAFRRQWPPALPVMMEPQRSRRAA